MTCTDSGAARARLDQGTKTYDKLNHKLSHRTRDKTALHTYLTGTKERYTCISLADRCLLVMTKESSTMMMTHTVVVIWT